MAELELELKNEYNIYKQRHTSHIHLKNTIGGIVLSDQWQKIVLDETNYVVKSIGGFTFDDANDRIYWDQGSVIGKSLACTFIGNASVQVTAGLTGTITVYMGLFINGVLILETPMNFTVVNSLGSYGGNGILVDAIDDNLLQPGSYYEFHVRADTGETPTIQVGSLNTIIQSCY